MRRLLPWALVALVGVGAALGAALGQANAPGTTSSSVLTGAAAQQWLSGVLAATKAAGSARLDLTGVSTSPHPLLRASSSGSGVVDFTSGTFRTSETDHSTEWSSDNGGPLHAQPQTTRFTDIGIGAALYQDFAPSGWPSSWTKMRDGRQKGDLGLASADGFGFVLSALTGPAAAVTVRVLGPASVDGVRVTRSVVLTEPRSPCPRSGRASTPAASTMVWVDSQGRLVQARTSFSLGPSFGAFVRKHDVGSPDVPVEPVTSTTTLRLSAFGAPVRVTAPSTRQPGGASAVFVTGSSTATLRCG